MREFKGTKGNWIADLRGGCCAVYPEDRKDDTNGCHSYDPRNIFYSGGGAKYNKEKGCWDQSEEIQANAKLIAAAPELLKACSLARTFLGNELNCDKDIFGVMEDLQSAINKALGDEEV